MINLLLGRPGSGKSYEAVVFHILPALQEGRKVITNLPLNLEAIRRVCPNAEDLIEIKSDLRAFTILEDFADNCKNEQEQGPLYVIDECHKPFPKGKTPLFIEEWFAEHRHLGVDVLLITQSYRKVSRSICDMVQTVYRLSNNRSMGSDKSRYMNANPAKRCSSFSLYWLRFASSWIRVFLIDCCRVSSANMAGMIRSGLVSCLSWFRRKCT